MVNDVWEAKTPATLTKIARRAIMVRTMVVTGTRMQEVMAIQIRATMAIAMGVATIATSVLWMEPIAPAIAHATPALGANSKLRLSYKQINI